MGIWEKIPFFGKGKKKEKDELSSLKSSLSKSKNNSNSQTRSSNSLSSNNSLQSPGIQDIPDSLSNLESSNNQETRNSRNQNSSFQNRSQNQRSNDLGSRSLREDREFSTSSMGLTDSQRRKKSSAARNNQSGSDKGNTGLSDDLIMAKIESVKAKVEVLDHKVDKVLEMLKNVY